MWTNYSISRWPGLKSNQLKDFEGYRRSRNKKKTLFINEIHWFKAMPSTNLNFKSFVEVVSIFPAMKNKLQVI